MTPADDAQPQREIEPADDGEGGYRLVGWNEKGLVATVAPSSGPVVPPAEIPRNPVVPPAQSDETAAPDYRRPSLPPKPFLTGTFGFPFSAGARVRAILLALGVGIVFNLAANSLDLGNSPDLASWLFSALIGAAALILGAMWFTFASACGLAVVRDTANGLGKIAIWPGFDFLDYLLEPLYLFNSLCASTLPGIVLNWLLVRYGAPGGVATAAVIFLLFPIVLLSMLENGSPLGAVSGPTWRTLVVAGRGWAAFYLASAAVLTIGCAMAALSLRIGNLLGIALAAATTAVVWLAYFRLLGRLAWYCADRAAASEPDAEAEDEEAEKEAEEQEPAEMRVQATEMVPVTFVFCPRCGKRVELGRVPVGAEVGCGGCGLEFAVQCKL